MMENDSIQDPSLSWAARGLLAYLLSLPDDWIIHLNDLFTRSPSGRRATQTAMDELIKAKYVKKKQGENKRNDTKYTVYEIPQS